jgi:hypothetical protein
MWQYHEKGHPYSVKAFLKEVPREDVQKVE